MVLNQHPKTNLVEHLSRLFHFPSCLSLSESVCVVKRQDLSFFLTATTAALNISPHGEILCIILWDSLSCEDIHYDNILIYLRTKEA